MTFFPLIDQRPLLPDGSEDCGEACVSAALQHLGHPVTPQQVLAVHAGVTSDTTILALVQQFGLKDCHATTGSFTNDDALAIVLIHDNEYANPDMPGEFEHWIVVYAQDAGGVWAMNPWGGRDIYYPLSEFNPAYIEAVVVPVAINLVAGVRDMPTPVPQRPAWIAQKVILVPGTQRGYAVDAWGGLHPLGGQPAAVGYAYWPGWNIVRDAVLRPDGGGGYTLDGWGGIHPFAAGDKAYAPPAPQGAPYWTGWDIAEQLIVTDWAAPGGYTVDGYGGVHAWGNAPAIDTKAQGAYWPGGVA